LIGLPVAFLPVPAPQTDFVAEAVPEPTGAVAVAPAPVANAVASTTRPAATHMTLSLIFVDLIRSLSSIL
jgi:hypothetical protein